MFDSNTSSDSFFSQFSGTADHIMLLILLINIVVHLIFAAGIARDIGHLHKLNLPTQIVPGFAWVLAGLIGGVFVGVAYWLVHHSSLARVSLK